MSILGGFYIYRTTEIPISDALLKSKVQEPEITGIVLFKNIGSDDEEHIIFGYFPIPSKLLANKGEATAADAEAFNPIRDFMAKDKKNYNVSSDKGIYDYYDENLREFLYKCYIPPLTVDTPGVSP